MELPKSCGDCPFCVNGFTEDAPVYECAVDSDEMSSVLVDDHGHPFDFRPDWCPLINDPIPTIRELAKQAGEMLVNAALEGLKGETDDR